MLEALAEDAERLMVEELAWFGLKGARLDVLVPIASAREASAAVVEFTAGELMMDETSVIDVPWGKIVLVEAVVISGELEATLEVELLLGNADETGVATAVLSEAEGEDESCVG